jgi:Tol biopolymer transport system component
MKCCTLGTAINSEKSALQTINRAIVLKSSWVMYKNLVPLSSQIFFPTQRQIMKTKLVIAIKSLIVIIVFAGCNLGQQESLTSGNTEISTVNDNSAVDSQSLIAFVSVNNGNQQLYLAKPDGSGQRAVNLDALDLQTDGLIPIGWSPDGSQLLIQTAYDSHNTKLYILNLENSDLHYFNDESLSAFFAGYPRWSPDGDKIAFAALDGIYISDVDGFTRKVSSDAAYPSWSPDGSQLVFLSNEGSIYVVASDGSAANLISNIRGVPQWSSSSAKITISVSTEELQTTWLINPDGTGALEIPLENGSVALPKLSPNGKRIAYLTFQNNLTDVYSMNIDGSDARLMMSDVGLLGYGVFDWSPDSNHIVFEVGQGSRLDLYVTHVDGSAPTRLTTEGENKWPIWGP